MQISDTAGQERFRTITTSYFRGAQGILLVYDVTDRLTFTSLRNWVAQIQMVRATSSACTNPRIASLILCLMIYQHADVNVNKILIGNKCDMADQRVGACRLDQPFPCTRCPYEEGEALAKEYNIHFFETSAKQDINVEKAFITIATDVKNRLIADGAVGGSGSGAHRLTANQPAASSGGCCGGK